VTEEDIAETAEKEKINYLIAILIVFKITGWHL
jgi:hypothetical protein